MAYETSLFLYLSPLQLCLLVSFTRRNRGSLWFHCWNLVESRLLNMVIYLSFIYIDILLVGFGFALVFKYMVDVSKIDVCNILQICIVCIVPRRWRELDQLFLHYKATYCLCGKFLKSVEYGIATSKFHGVCKEEGDFLFLFLFLFFRMCLGVSP